MRVEDEWYNAFLEQCRAGCLDDEMYNFMSPTEHCGTWMPPPLNKNTRIEGFAVCANPICMTLHNTWKHMSEQGKNWQDMVSMEC